MAKVTGGAHEKGFEFAKGGSTKMFPLGHANAMAEGQTAKASQDAGKGGKFAEGGKTKMFPMGHAKPAQAGKTMKDSQ